MYRWDATHSKDHVEWEADTIVIQPPIFKYVGHAMAHPERVKVAQNIFLNEARAQPKDYERLPSNAWEQVQLVNTVLTPKWTYRLLLIPNDAIFKELDKFTKEFVTQCKGLERVRHTKISTPYRKEARDCTNSSGHSGRDM